MVGIIVELIVSWLLLWIFFRKNLSALGLTPNKSRLIFFLSGFLIAAICCIMYQYLSMIFIDNRWLLNNQFTFKDLLSGSWWTFKSVLFEELIFRGAILYILIKKVNVTTACIISAIAFGIYHWFSYNAFGNPFIMLIIFIMTSLPGYIFAISFARTMSLYLPVALHFGWNLVNILIFSNGPLGTQLLIRENDNQAQGILSVILFLLQLLLLPLATMAYLKLANPRPAPLYTQDRIH